MAMLRKRAIFGYQRAREAQASNDAEAAKGAKAPQAPQAAAAASEPPKPKPVVPTAAPEFLRGEELRTSLSADAVVNGKLSFTTPTRIDGKLKGEIRCTDLLVIGPTAVVEGLVKASVVRIEGTVRGEIVETRKVEIRRGGRFSGRLRADRLVLEEGGFLDAQCRMSAGEPAERGVAEG